MNRIKFHVIDWDAHEAVAIWEHEGRYGVAYGDKYPFVAPDRAVNINHVGRGGVTWYNTPEEAEKHFLTYIEEAQG